MQVSVLYCNYKNKCNYINVSTYAHTFLCKDTQAIVFKKYLCTDNSATFTCVICTSTDFVKKDRIIYMLINTSEIHTCR